MFCFVMLWQFCSFIKAWIKCASELSICFLPVQPSIRTGGASVQLGCSFQDDFVVLGFSSILGNMEGGALSTVRSDAE